ncbi:hypothetical protein AVEN_108122-1 [Araneus ventricosus]|uniref:Uncharacterized protein n=1 Tax=Araneus ventricosus TaxID=182803 RepID=A0A4Y2H4B0_ARAVE|nr:hypothetical protein AVEN_108122-1 [Araneus ventricosus]
MSGIKDTWISCIMQMRMERHTCSPETTTIKRMFLLGCTLKLRVMAKLGINEYCDVLLIYGECGRIDAERRYTWFNFVMNNLEDHPTFLADMIWTDEACVSRNGLFNRQNVHTSSLENPRCAVEVRHQLRWSINVWYGIFNDRLIGPVFYEGTLTGQRYLELLKDVITDFVENLPLHQLRSVWFQHDCASPHKISYVTQYLMDTFQIQSSEKKRRARRLTHEEILKELQRIDEIHSGDSEISDLDGDEEYGSTESNNSDDESEISSQHDSECPESNIWVMNILKLPPSVNK